MEHLKSVLTTDMKHCYICGSENIHLHHVFGASNKRHSEEYGYIIPLHPAYHNMSNKGVHHNREFDLMFKRMAQSHFEKHYGSRDDFIKIFGKSWIY